MKTFKVLWIVFVIFILSFSFLSTSSAKNSPVLSKGLIDKPPDVIQGGEWKDDFWIGQFQETNNVDIQLSQLFLKYKEQLHWIQTWNAQFANGDFFQTEAESDSVRLAWDVASHSYFTAGIYTSTVFYAGKPVDWAYSEWNYSGVPEGIVIEFRTGNTLLPGDSWTDWTIPQRGNFQYICAYTLPSEETECFNNMIGIISSQYIQYRATFSSDHPTNTIKLYDIDLLYGIHYLSGSALSIPIPPVDLREWKSVLITSTIPAHTTLVIDLLDSNGSVLIHNIHNGTNLEGIDPINYPILQLRASFTSTDESISPDLDLWGLKWYTWNKLYLPAVHR